MFFVFTSFVSTKRYADNVIVPVYGTKVSPYHNPFETYNYYSLPFCKYPGKDAEPPSRLSDAFLGNQLQRTSYMVYFKQDVNNSKTCTVELSDSVKSKFKEAIQRKFYYQLYIDKLPIWSLVGAKELKNSDQYYIYSRQNFLIYYNTNRIISVILNPEEPVSLNSNSVDFKYSVEWISTNQTRNERILSYRNNKFFGQSNPLSNTYYFLIIVCIFLLIAIFFLIRSIGKDFSRYQREAEYNDFEIDFHAEKGWKLIHADVFRPPRKYALLSILFGNGAQIFTALLVYFLINVIFCQFFSRGTYLYMIAFSYSIAAVVGGYFSAGLYKRWGGSLWIKQLVATTLIVPVIFFSSEFLLDLFALLYKITKMSKIKPYLILFFVLIFVILPLTIFGGIFGRHRFIIGPNPVKVSMVRRSIPPQPFYLNNWFISFIIGSCSFLCVYAEIHSLLNAIVQYQVNYVWILALIVLLLLACVISCLTSFAIYKKLSAEDYEWQWISFAGPFSISFFIFAYSLYYFFRFTKFSGIMQYLYFFNYTLILSTTIGVVCGFIGFTVSALFVRRIYTNVKAD